MLESFLRILEPEITKDYFYKFCVVVLFYRASEGNPIIGFIKETFPNLVDIKKIPNIYNVTYNDSL